MAEVGTLIFWIVFSLVTLWVTSAVIKVYNKLVLKDTSIQIQEGQINAGLQKREDLVKQLSVVIKESGKFERRTQVRLSRERSGRRGNTRLPLVQATSERYPRLESVKEGFRHLQEQIAGIESLLKTERSSYNALVGEYKVYTRSFPIFLVAYPLGFKSGKYQIYSTTVTKKPEFWQKNQKNLKGGMINEK